MPPRGAPKENVKGPSPGGVDSSLSLGEIPEAIEGIGLTRPETRVTLLVALRPARNVT